MQEVHLLYILYMCVCMCVCPLISGLCYETDSGIYFVCVYLSPLFADLCLSFVKLCSNHIDAPRT